MAFIPGRNALARVRTSGVAAFAVTAYPCCAACKNFIIAGGMGVCRCWRMTMSLKDAEAQVRCPYWLRAEAVEDPYETFD